MQKVEFQLNVHNNQVISTGDININKDSYGNIPKNGHHSNKSGLINQDLNLKELTIARHLEDDHPELGENFSVTNFSVEVGQKK